MNNYDLQVDIGRRIFMEYDQERIIAKFRLGADDTWIYLRYLDTPCRIRRETGEIWEYTQGQWRECRNFGTVMTVYDLLCYHREAEQPTLAGEWCAVGTFVVTGVTNTEGFTKKYARLFSGRLEALKRVCRKMGGEELPPMAGADLTFRVDVTPFFPVLVQFWECDEEFPPKLLILWDRNTDRWMHFETTFYLQGDLLERLRDHMEEEL